MIKAKVLSKEYFVGDTLFSGVDFVLSKNEKVGLVGPNGCGKTTLLKIIAGVEAPTAGNLLIENEKVGYLPQELDLPLDMLLGEFIETLLKTNEKYLVEKNLSLMGLTQLDEYEKIKLMSEGEKMKLKLAEILLQQPTCLILDEPTNHLDIDGILWFEDFVKNFRGNVLMISHDRSFLNNTVSKIFEIENKEFHVFSGNYDDYVEQKRKLIEKKGEEYVRFLKKKKQLEDLLLLAHKIGGGKRNAVQAAQTRYDREIEQSKVEKYEVKRIKDLSLEGSTHSSKLVVEGVDLVKKFGEKSILQEANFEIRGKEKVWLFGPNGTGKSTLVKMIMGEQGHDSGNLKIGNNLKIGYFAQTNDALNYDSTLFDFFMNESGLSYGQIYGTLEKFLFSKEASKKKIKSLSPGERARLKLALFTLKEYEFLILDEPTNHLDIAAKEVIEEALRNYDGTLLLVSHDRYFVSEVGVDKVFELRNGKLKSSFV